MVVTGTIKDKIACLARKSKIIARLGRAGLDLCFPPRCLGCDSLEVETRLLLCPACLARFPLLARPLCSCCGMPFVKSGSDHDHLCAVCLQKPWAFSKARALLCYDEQVAHLIRAFKFQGRRDALATFATLARRSETIADLASPDMVVPVPLHPRRLRQRGFNQAAVLAARLPPRLRPRISHALVRIRDTTPQRGLDGRQRRRNVRGSFALTPGHGVAGRKILLCDDVFTTGSTLNECATTLLAAGAARLEVVTLAMVVKE